MRSPRAPSTSGTGRALRACTCNRRRTATLVSSPGRRAIATISSSPLLSSSTCGVSRSPTRTASSERAPYERSATLRFAAGTAVGGYPRQRAREVLRPSLPDVEPTSGHAPTTAAARRRYGLTSIKPGSTLKHSGRLGSRSVSIRAVRLAVCPPRAPRPSRRTIRCTKSRFASTNRHRQ